MDRFTYKKGYTMNGADRPWWTIYDNGERITEVNNNEEAHHLCVIMNKLNFKNRHETVLKPENA